MITHYGVDVSVNNKSFYVSIKVKSLEPHVLEQTNSRIKGCCFLLQISTDVTY